jgi:hypothetical protein
LVFEIEIRTMKLLTKPILAVIIGLLPLTATAEPEFPFYFERPAGLGVGVVLGVPTGVSIAYRQDEGPFWDAALAWSVTEQSVHVHGDYLVELTQLIDPHAPNTRFPLYAGAGVRLGFKNTRTRANQVQVGLRVPVGINVMPQGVDIDIFVELVPVMSLFPETKMSFEGAVCARYYY